jgi:hypothetical protein
MIDWLAEGGIARLGVPLHGGRSKWVICVDDPPKGECSDSK